MESHNYFLQLSIFFTWRTKDTFKNKYLSPSKAAKIIHIYIYIYIYCLYYIVMNLFLCLFTCIFNFCLNSSINLRFRQNFPLYLSFIISMFCLAFLQITNLFLSFLKIKTFHKMLLYNISFRCIKSHILFIRLFVLAYFLCPIQIWSV